MSYLWPLRTYLTLPYTSHCGKELCNLVIEWTKKKKYKNKKISLPYIHYHMILFSSCSFSASEKEYTVIAVPLPHHSCNSIFLIDACVSLSRVERVESTLPNIAGPGHSVGHSVPLNHFKSVPAFLALRSDLHMCWHAVYYRAAQARFVSSL